MHVPTPPLSEEQIIHRRASFNRIWAANLDNLKLADLPANVQGRIHDIAFRFFKAGSNYEARMNELEMDDGK